MQTEQIQQPTRFPVFEYDPAGRLVRTGWVTPYDKLIEFFDRTTTFVAYERVPRTQ